MECKVETCSHCGNIVSGNLVRTDEQELTRTVAKKGTNKILIYIAGTVIGTFILPVVGTVLGLVICLIAGFMIDGYSERATNAIENSLFKTLRYEYVCPKCGHKWTRYMSKNEDYTPIEVLKREKENILVKLRDSKSNQFFMLCVCSILTILCILYCIFNDYKTSLGMKEVLFFEYEDFEYNYLWYFLCFASIFTVIGIIYHCSNFMDTKKVITEIENLSEEEFRHSPLRYKYR